MIYQLAVSANERSVVIEMDISPDFVTDQVLKATIEHGHMPEPELVELMARVLQPGDLMVDGGANAGLFTLVGAKYVGPTGKVIAVEPGENNIPKIKGNIIVSNDQHIALVEQPLWSSAKEVEFYLYQDSGHNSVGGSDMPDHQVKIMATTLDEVCGDLTPKLIKLDIEGSEVEALKGADKLLKRKPPFIVCEMNVTALAENKTSPAEMRELMQEYDYDAFVLYPGGQLPPFVPYNCGLAPFRLNSNILFSTLNDVGKAWGKVRW